MWQRDVNFSLSELPVGWNFSFTPVQLEHRVNDYSGDHEFILQVVSTEIDKFLMFNRITPPTYHEIKIGRVALK